VPHQQQQADPDVARVLVSGISGIHPDKITGYALFTDNSDCGLHLTTNACCAHHAVEQVIAVWFPELDTLTPCSGDGH
jgi:hypothetical protein